MKGPRRNVLPARLLLRSQKAELWGEAWFTGIYLEISVLHQTFGSVVARICLSSCLHKSRCKVDVKWM